MEDVRTIAGFFQRSYSIYSRKAVVAGEVEAKPSTQTAVRELKLSYTLVQKPYYLHYISIFW